jgi:hypothetical protein
MQMRSRDDLLREIDRDLRREEELWREIRRDLEELEGPPTAREPGRIIGVVVVGVLLLVAAFGLGWNLAPTTTGTTTASALERMRTANAQSIEYADQAMHMSSQIGRLNGELVRTRALLTEGRLATADVVELSDQLMHMSSQIGRLNGELARTQTLLAPMAQ